MQLDEIHRGRSLCSSCVFVQQMPGVWVETQTAVVEVLESSINWSAQAFTGYVIWAGRAWNMLSKKVAEAETIPMFKRHPDRQRIRQGIV